MGIKTEKRSKSSSSTSPCAHLRIAYHDCFNRWYSEKFLKGQWDKEDCVAEWRKYRECLSRHLEDKQLSRFLDIGSGGSPDYADRVDSESSADGVSTGSSE
ncbi:hypothetical protein Nepgr_008778 [Nepenthes gracilis]|uniref:Uncharacterized protein n=1 Tax=Nepenthes gracilis TaxID=150966 RepID=A0AAD3S9L6_NEPGR|nr:hypothetical protein Nepgr_008778 [Nepenthes gracilis]